MDVEFIGQSVEYIGGYGGTETIVSAARTCTQTMRSDDKPAKVSEYFVRSLLNRGHMSPIEFGFADMRLEVDRAIQAQYLRHRHFSFNVESTRFCDYRKKPLRFVTKPPEGMDVPEMCVDCLEEYCALGARLYESWANAGVSRDYLRKFLVLALASRMRMAGNLRSWFEMLPKRLDKAAHAEAREVAGMILKTLKAKFKGVFDGIGGGDEAT